MSVKAFIDKHYKHFNAAVLKDAARAWVEQINRGDKMFLAMAGAMSTGEIGISLAELIRRDKIHAISTTGANLEEDIFNLVAHNDYRRIPDYRNLSLSEEVGLRDSGFNRVTDTCIPEEKAMRKIEGHILKLWQKAEAKGASYFPYEFICQLFESKALANEYQIDPKDSWVMAAYEKKIPIYTPGWEDSTLGNVFVSNITKGKLQSSKIVKSGPEQMQHLIQWYLEHSREQGIGFFQIGGGIAGDFPICVVPLIHQDLKKECRLWNYFAQISDSTTSYGSYSGAHPNEKITWYKLDTQAPKFVIESDATIVAPLIFQYILES